MTQNKESPQSLSLDWEKLLIDLDNYKDLNLGLAEQLSLLKSLSKESEEQAIIQFLIHLFDQCEAFEENISKNEKSPSYLVASVLFFTGLLFMGSTLVKFLKKVGLVEEAIEYLERLEELQDTHYEGLQD